MEEPIGNLGLTSLQVILDLHLKKGKKKTYSVIEPTIVIITIIFFFLSNRPFSFRTQ